MTRASLLHILDHVSAISDAEVRELEQLATAFPYCQTAHLLLAKAAHDKGSMLAGQRLRRAATYAPDRQLLRQLIEFRAPEVVPPPVADAPAQTEVAPLLPAAADAPLLLPEAPAAATAPEAVVAPPAEAAAVTEPPEPPAAVEPAATPDPTSELPATPAEPAAEALLLATDAERQTEDPTAEKEPAEAADSPEAAVEVAEEVETVEAAAVATGAAEAVEIAATETATTETAAAEVAADDEAPLPLAAPPIRPPAGTARPEFGPGDASVDYTAYALTAEPLDSPAVTAPAEPFYADEEVGYGFDGGSRLGPCLRPHNELTRDLPAAEFFPPDALLLAHAADEMPAGAAPSSLAIIERFLQQQPRLRTPAAPPATNGEQADLSVASTSVPPALASESLAIILVRQGKTAKAIEIYERLMMRQPEKKAYFATQIDQLKQSE